MRKTALLSAFIVSVLFSVDAFGTKFDLSRSEPAIEIEKSVVCPGAQEGECIVTPFEGGGGYIFAKSGEGRQAVFIRGEVMWQLWKLPDGTILSSMKGEQGPNLLIHYSLLGLGLGEDMEEKLVNNMLTKEALEVLVADSLVMRGYYFINNANGQSR